MLLNCGVGEDSSESLDNKESKPVNPKGNKTWIFIGRIDAEAEAPILWPPDVNSPFIIKDPDAGKDWRHEEKGTTEDKMVRCNYRFNGHEFEQTEIVKDREAYHAAVHGVTKSQTWLSDWITICVCIYIYIHTHTANLVPLYAETNIILTTL